jgi:predicted Ser/Thr protein kinase
VEALSALVARLVVGLHGLTADGVCPGGWPWAVSLFGVGVGLLPAAGAAAVALWRRRIGSRYGLPQKAVLVAIGLITAGVGPLVLFRATGRLFAAVAAHQRVTGLTGAQLRSLNAAVCIAGPQSRYLGSGHVVDAFGSTGPLRAGLAVLVLIGMPVIAALFTAASARLATRRGPRWPVRLFWLPLLAVAVLTGDLPPGSTGHLWFGAAAGAFLGIPVVLAVGTPTWVVVRRSVADGRLAELRRSDVARRSGRAPVPGTGSGAVPPARGGRWAERLATRFAGRQPEPVVGPAAAVSSVAGSTDAGTPRNGDRPDPAGPGGVAPTGPPPVGPRGTAVLNGAPRPGTPTPGAPARFRLERRLGSGGFGSVWLAHDARRGETVALKTAHVRDTDTEERIRREARALAAVRHPHCVQIHDLVPAHSDPGLAELDGMVIVMEYVRGESLGERVRARGTVDDITAARVWATIAGALDAAHRRGVLHRDVKPGNVVVDADSQAHLIDFGIARQTGDATLTAAGFVLGTPDFLAPEVAAGGPATPQSDAWQLAATIGYALSGQPPRGEHPDAVSGLRAAALGRPVTHLPRRSAHLALLQAALDADPARRPTLPAVQAALGTWLRAAARPDGAVTAGPDPR